MRKNNAVRGAKILLLALGLLATPVVGQAADLKVRGLGWLGNHKARNHLRLLLGEQSEGAIAASAIEDAALILFSELAGEGYLEPRVTAILTLPDGRRVEHALNARLDEPLPRPLAATAVELQIERGRRLELEEIHFTGLHVIDEADARGYFVGESTLIPVASARIYSPGRLRRAMANLQEELQQQGHAEASVTLTEVEIDREKGTVLAHVAVHEGLPWVVGSLRFAIAGDAAPPELETAAAGARWTALWRQGLGTEIRRWYNERGFPDVRVRVAPEAGPPENGQRLVAVTAHINPGIPVRLGAVRFEGNTRTRESVLRRRVSLQPGEPLNPLALDTAQARMSRLGVFDELILRYEPADGPVRDAVFAAKEGRRMEVNLLLGYGSYEQFRGGIEMNHHNLFGRAHTSRLTLVQSMKSSSAEHLYTVPEIFGTEVAGTARLFGVRREELSFLREEFGSTVSLRWPLGASSLTTAYSFRHLRNTHNELATSGTDDIQTNAASVEVGWLRDRRDNPLTPRHGYKLFAHVEEASRFLGGQVDYQRLLLDASYHTKWGHGRWIHAGLTHGLITTFGEENDLSLPVNVRYFPGGDGSIRGYQRGEAAPRAANGQFIGAKTYLQLNVELEQALTQKFSAVLFFDAIGTAVRIADYPFSEQLYTAGLGVRYNTLIGPLRVEYGYNLNPRPLDPRGTLQLSLGFPF